MFPKHIPHVLNRIKIRRVSGPLYALDTFTFKEVVDQDRKMTRCVIIHKYEFRTDTTSKMENIRLKGFVSFIFQQ